MNTLDKILYQLKINGLTDIKFQELAGLSAGTVRDWKNGKSKSYKKHLPKIADVLKTTPEHLLDVGDPYLDVDKKEVFNRILDLKDNISQSDVTFYVRIGVSSSLFYKWKRGESDSYMDMLDEISEYFGVTTNYLLGKSIAENPPKMVMMEKGSDIFAEYDRLPPEAQERMMEYYEMLISRYLTDDSEAKK